MPPPIANKIQGTDEEGDDIRSTHGVESSRSEHKNVFQYQVEQTLIRQKTDLNQKLLLNAVVSGKLYLVKCLIDNGANVNEETNDGSVLLQAVLNDNVEMAKLLIDNGANVNATTENGSVLDQAVLNGNVEMAKLLIDNGANVNEETNDGSVLLQAVLNDNVEMAAFLIEKGANVNATTENGSLLFQAVRNGNMEMAKRLIECGADKGSLIEKQLGALNNIKLRSEIEGWNARVAEYVMNDIMREMSKENDLTQLPLEEQRILESISQGNDDCKLYHTGFQGHCTSTLIFQGGSSSYLMHTNKGWGSKDTFSIKKGTYNPLEFIRAKNSIIYSEDKNKIQNVLKDLKEQKNASKFYNNIMTNRFRKSLDNFKSSSGNTAAFIKAIESITGTLQTMGNCWIKSLNEALEIRMFIGFLKADGFNFDSQEEGDYIKIESAKQKAKELFRKVRLKRVRFSKEIVEDRTKGNEKILDDEYLLKQLKLKEKKTFREVGKEGTSQASSF